MKPAFTFVALLLTTSAFAAEEGVTATRYLEGAKSTFPKEELGEGVSALIDVLDSCHDISDHSVKFTAEDLKKAQAGEHVRFVFSKPRAHKLHGQQMVISEVVFAKGVFWVVDGTEFVRMTKYRFEKMERFAKWFRQTLPAD
jgi:hypothetical protein